jgi:hypothetical protein
MIERKTFKEVVTGHVFWSHGRAWGKKGDEPDSEGNNASQMLRMRSVHFGPDHPVIVGDWNEAKAVSVAESDAADRMWADGVGVR